MAEKNLNTLNNTSNILGLTFKQLRLAKGLTQKEVAGELSTTSLSHFENGKCIPHVDHFLKLLRNINVNTYEFQFLYNLNQRHSDVTVFDSRVSMAYYKRDVIQLKAILDEIINLEQDNPNIRHYKLEKIRVKAVISLLEPFEITTKEINFLKTYLSEIKEWGQYDIKLFGQCSHLFDGYTLWDLTNNMISPTQKSLKLQYTRHALIDAVLNVISQLIHLKFYSLTTDFITFLENINIDDRFLYEKITLVYDKAILQYVAGDVEAAKIIKKCKEDLVFYNCYDTVNLIQRDLDNLEINE